MMNLDEQLDLLKPAPTSGEQPPNELEKLLGSMDPVSPLLAPSIRILLPLAVGIIVVLYTVLNANLRSEHGWLLWGLPLAKAGMACGLMWLALRGAVPGHEPSRQVMLISMVAAAAALIGLSVLGDSYSAHHLADKHGPKCSVALLGISALPLAALYWLLMRGAVFRPAMCGGIAGLSVGLLCDSALHLTCPVTAFNHTLLYHAGGVIALALVSGTAAWVLRKWLFKSAR